MYMADIVINTQTVTVIRPHTTYSLSLVAIPLYYKHRLIVNDPQSAMVILSVATL